MRAPRKAFTAMRPLADLVGPSIADACGKAGFSTVEIVTHWDEIAGPELGPRSMPVRLQWPRTGSGEPATLMVRVEGPYAIEMQYAASVLIERINTYFGWRCVGRLALRQGPVPSRSIPVPPPPPKASELAETRAALGTFEDEALAEALARLGALVRRDRRTG